MNYFNQNNQKSGYVAILSVIIIGAIISVLIVSVFSVSVNYHKVNLSATRRLEAKIFANSCVEVALQAINDGSDNKDYNLNFENGSCFAIIERPADYHWEIKSTGQADNSVQKIYVLVFKEPKESPVILSWRYVKEL